MISLSSQQPVLHAVLDPPKHQPSQHRLGLMSFAGEHGLRNGRESSFCC